MRYLLSVVMSVLLSVNVAFAGNPTILLVHGDMFTGESWNDVKTKLVVAGYTVVTPDMPGVSPHTDPKSVTLETSAKSLCAIIDAQREAVVVVAHGLNGAVMTQAAAMCPDSIRALVYVAAVAPLPNESIGQTLSEDDHASIDMGTRFEEKAFVISPNPLGLLKETMMSDLSDAKADVVIKTMVSQPAGIASDKLHYSVDIFKSIPVYYIETTRDQIVSIETQKKMEAQLHPVEIMTMTTSHVPFISQPTILANNIISIASKYVTHDDPADGEQQDE